MVEICCFTNKPTVFFLHKQSEILIYCFAKSKQNVNWDGNCLARLKTQTKFYSLSHIMRCSLFDFDLLLSSSNVFDCISCK